MTAKTARLVINSYPMVVLSNEWLEELFCELCGATTDITSPKMPLIKTP